MFSHCSYSEEVDANISVANTGVRIIVVLLTSNGALAGVPIGAGHENAVSRAWSAGHRVVVKHIGRVRALADLDGVGTFALHPSLGHPATGARLTSESVFVPKLLRNGTPAVIAGSD